MAERELKVSELAAGAVVRVWKEGRPTLQMRVLEILPSLVAFRVLPEDGCPLFGFLAQRSGPDLEQITDEDKLRMRIFEVS